MELIRINKRQRLEVKKKLQYASLIKKLNNGTLLNMILPSKLGYKSYRRRKIVRLNIVFINILITN